MYSIIGHYGNETAAPIIVKGLKRMEYRGYDKDSRNLAKSVTVK
jgi:glucosamine 6-phosphate synthetase-like amidotransferase/phosphosugar isomerase protein